MFTSISRKWIAVPFGVLALVLLSGAGTTLASQTHYRPATSYHSSTQAAQALSQTGHERQFVGMVQSIDQAKQTFRLQPSSQAKAVDIAYDARTGIPKDHWTMQGSRGTQVAVQVMMRHDGSWYATRITPVTVQGKSGPAPVQSGSYPTWRDGPCGWRDHHGSGYHR